MLIIFDEYYDKIIHLGFEIVSNTLLQSIACFCLLEQHLFWAKGIQPKGNHPLAGVKATISYESRGVYGKLIIRSSTE